MEWGQSDCGGMEWGQENSVHGLAAASCAAVAGDLGIFKRELVVIGQLLSWYNPEREGKGGRGGRGGREGERGREGGISG